MAAISAELFPHSPSLGLLGGTNRPPGFPVDLGRRSERTKGKSGLMKEEREELTRLRKENRELRIERDLLKKVSALFARHQQ